MIPSIGNRCFTQEASQQRVSEYISQLFAQGELDDVISLTQQELASHPENLDLMVYWACAVLVLQVSGTVRHNDSLLGQAMLHLQTIAELMHHTDPAYDDCLDFYLALGNLVLGKFDEADRLLAFITPILKDEQESLVYYESRKSYWQARLMIPMHPQPSRLTFLS